MKLKFLGKNIITNHLWCQDAIIFDICEFKLCSSGVYKLVKDRTDSRKAKKLKTVAEC